MKTIEEYWNKVEVPERASDEDVAGVKQLFYLGASLIFRFAEYMSDPEVSEEDKQLNYESLLTEFNEVLPGDDQCGTS